MKKNDILLTSGQRRNFKKHLQQGDINTIAEIANVNRITVNRWFANYSHNMTIQETVIKLFQERSIHISKTIEEIMADKKS